MVKRSVSLGSLCLFILLMLSGCWDNISIEERGFVVGSALDVKNGKIDGRDELTLTNQFVVPTAFANPSGGGGGGDSGGELAYSNLSANGDSVFAMDTEMASLTSKQPFFEHLKLLVISEELASTPHLFSNMFDVFIRDKEMRRTVKVVVAGEEAKDLLNFQPKNAKLPAIFINDMLEESLKKTGLFKPALVGDIHQYFLRNNSFTIPKLIRKGDHVEYDGAAVIHSYKDRMVGTLNREDMTGLNLMLGDMHGGTMEFKYKGDLITFQIFNAKAVTRIDDKNPHRLKFNIDLGMEGGIIEVFGNKNFNNLKYIEGVEKAAEKKAEAIVSSLIEKSQRELHAEIFDFDNQLRERHYDTWQKIKDNWDHGEDYFAKSEIHVKAKVKVRSIGALNKTKNNKKEQ